MLEHFRRPAGFRAGTHQPISTASVIWQKIRTWPRRELIAEALPRSSDAPKAGCLIGSQSESLTRLPTAFELLDATGAYAGGTLGGLNTVDLWIGGLAEETMVLGGMLGSTFQFVFEPRWRVSRTATASVSLQRLNGLRLFGEMESNSFAYMIMRNTNASASTIRRVFDARA